MLKYNLLIRFSNLHLHLNYSMQIKEFLESKMGEREIKMGEREKQNRYIDVSSINKS